MIRSCIAKGRRGWPCRSRSTISTLRAIFNRVDDEPDTRQRHSNAPPCPPFARGEKKDQTPPTFPPFARGDRGGGESHGACNGSENRSRP